MAVRSKIKGPDPRGRTPAPKEWLRDFGPALLLQDAQPIFRALAVATTPPNLATLVTSSQPGVVGAVKGVRVLLFVKANPVSKTAFRWGGGVCVWGDSARAHAMVKPGFQWVSLGRGGEWVPGFRVLGCRVTTRAHGKTRFQGFEMGFSGGCVGGGNGGRGCCRGSQGLGLQLL